MNVNRLLDLPESYLAVNETTLRNGKPAQYLLRTTSVPVGVYIGSNEYGQASRVRLDSPIRCGYYVHLFDSVAAATLAAAAIHAENEHSLWYIEVEVVDLDSLTADEQAVVRNTAKSVNETLVKCGVPANKHVIVFTPRPIAAGARSTPLYACIARSAWGWADISALRSSRGGHAGRQLAVFDTAAMAALRVQQFPEHIRDRVKCVPLDSVTALADAPQMVCGQLA